MAARTLTIDAGNTAVSFGLFEKKKLIRELRVPTAGFKFPPLNGRVDQVIISSVVPGLNRRLAGEAHRRFGLKPHFVDWRNIPVIAVKLKRPGEVGADRLVDALAAHKLYGGPAIIVDFGTATTFDVVTARGEYLGGAISPGLLLARDALHERTAKLPRIEVKAPPSVIGKDTVEAMRSGLVFGYVALVEGMIGRIKSKVKSQKSKVKVIATGGLAKLICKYTSIVDIIDDKLTLKGLRLISELRK
ncbi:MAG: type III pantothenate kinase [Candidatus Saganbacteria bacterium]|nr:type III pantothenate kinase [Candidatus Saganbacteria bacterium]